MIFYVLQLLKKALNSLLFFCLLLSACLATSQESVPTNTDIEMASKLIQLINTRVELIQQVAYLKFPYLDKVYDARREQEVLRNTQKKALVHGLPVPETLIFSQVNMDLSKQIQSQIIRQHIDSGGKPQSSKSLTELRDLILAVDSNLYSTLASVKQSTRRKLIVNLFTARAEKEIVVSDGFKQHKTMLIGTIHKIVI